MGHFDNQLADQINISAHHPDYQDFAGARRVAMNSNVLRVREYDHLNVVGYASRCAQVVFDEVRDGLTEQQL